MDKFPEAFQRFEQKVNVRNIKTFAQLELSFSGWAGWKWKGTPKQKDGLAVQAIRLGIPTEDYYRREQRKFDERRQWDDAIFREPQIEEVTFSRKYSSFQQWQTQTLRTTAYQRRINNYLRNHPNASLAEARGHGAKE